MPEIAAQAEGRSSRSACRLHARLRARVQQLQRPGVRRQRDGARERRVHLGCRLSALADAVLPRWRRAAGSGRPARRRRQAGQGYQTHLSCRHRHGPGAGAHRTGDEAAGCQVPGCAAAHHHRQTGRCQAPSEAPCRPRAEPASRRRTGGRNDPGQARCRCCTLCSCVRPGTSHAFARSRSTELEATIRLRTEQASCLLAAGEIRAPGPTPWARWPSARSRSVR